MNPGSDNRDDMGRYGHWYNSGLNVIGVTKHFLVGFKAHATRQNMYIPGNIIKAKKKKDFWKTHTKIISKDSKLLSINPLMTTQATSLRTGLY